MNCGGCGKNESVPSGKSMPPGWIEVINPLFGKEWSVIACSHACASNRRIRDILVYQTKKDTDNAPES